MGKDEWDEIVVKDEKYNKNEQGKSVKCGSMQGGLEDITRVFQEVTYTEVSSLTAARLMGQCEPG